MTGSFSYLLVLNAAEGTIQIVLAREEMTDAGQEGEDPGNGPSRIPAPVPVHFSEWHAPSQGAELLVPALADICARFSLSPRAIRRIACVSGPGSFTGLRLILSTASGLSRASGALSAGMPYLPLLAQGAARAIAPGLMPDTPPPVFWVLTHARRNLVHFQGFSHVAEGGEGPDTGAPGVTPVTELLVLSLDAAAARIQAEPRPSVLLGSGVSRNAEFWRKALPATLPQARILPESLGRPSPEVLLHTASALPYTARDVEPLYARPCDAEENLGQIARKLGLDPAQAQKALHLFTHSPADAVRG